MRFCLIENTKRPGRTQVRNPEARYTCQPPTGSGRRRGIWGCSLPHAGTTMWWAPNRTSSGGYRYGTRTGGRGFEIGVSVSFPAPTLHAGPRCIPSGERAPPQWLKTMNPTGQVVSPPIERNRPPEVLSELTGRIFFGPVYALVLGDPRRASTICAPPKRF